MIKTIILLKRRSGITREAFSEYWSAHHAQIIARLPGLSRHVQNHVLAGPNGSEPAFDGVAESWIADETALRQLLISDAYKDMLADEENLIDRDATILLRVREVDTKL